MKKRQLATLIKQKSPYKIMYCMAFLLFALPFLLLTGCATQKTHPLFIASKAAPINEYTSFAEYVDKTEQMLRANRYFLTENKEQEIQANLPFEVRPKTNGPIHKGVLLVHGLSDSPFSFVDIAKALADNGFLVRTVLLPGHGTRPADLLGIDQDDWKNLVAKQMALLKQDVENVYVGGFSTGANLAYSYAVQDPAIKGLMLFSPGFKSDEPLLFMTPFLASITDWLRETNPDGLTNYARYSTAPVNALAQYYTTSIDALDALEKRPFTRPVFMVLSEHDSVLDTKYLKKLFDTRFINHQSRLIWYGHTASRIEGRTRYIISNIPELRISSMSHMGILFAPHNPYYGINGLERICRNAPDALEADLLACKNGEPVWYSAWGHDVEGKPFHARLTFNPDFDVMIGDLLATFNDS